MKVQRLWLRTVPGVRHKPQGDPKAEVLSLYYALVSKLAAY